MNKFLNPLRYYAYLRARSIRRRLATVGENFVFDPMSTILEPELISIGNQVFIGERALVSAELTIDDNVMFGPRPMIIGGDHYFGVRGHSVRTLRPLGRENSRPIHVESEAWFGAAVIILAGVTVGMGAAVGAGSVLTKSIPPFVIAVGNPCRPIKRIFSDSSLLAHLRLLGRDEQSAVGLVNRRHQEIETMGLVVDELPVVDQPGIYWATSSAANP